MRTQYAAALIKAQALSGAMGAQSLTSVKNASGRGLLSQATTERPIPGRFRSTTERSIVMNRRANILIAAIAAITSIPVVAADSPKERYGIDKTCAAASAVAIEQNGLPANITANQAMPIAALYLKRTQASGERVGLDPATISRGIDAVHQSIVAKLTSSDTKRAITERSDTARMMENCTALVGFELLGSVAAH